MMRASGLFCVSVATVLICLAAPGASMAQSGAPVPLAGNNNDGYVAQNYVPLPPGMEAEPIDTYLEGDVAAIAPPPVIEMEVTPAPVEIDPVVLCQEKVGMDNQSALSDCLEETHAESEVALNDAAVAAHAHVKPEGPQAVRTLASSNMSFIAFRDSECMRQKKMTADNGAASQIDWACRTILNNMRSRMLRGM